MGDFLTSNRTTRIRELNDSLRSTFKGGKVMMSAGVDALDTQLKVAVLMAVQKFNDFSEDNDPHHEHDFGAFEMGPRKFFWKVDYYDEELIGGSEDPSDPAKTTRVLTVMLAEDY
jgi:hypothetical protein